MGFTGSYDDSNVLVNFKISEYDIKLDNEQFHINKQTNEWKY